MGWMVEPKPSDFIRVAQPKFQKQMIREPRTIYD